MTETETEAREAARKAANDDLEDAVTALRLAVARVVEEASDASWNAAIESARFNSDEFRELRKEMGDLVEYFRGPDGLEGQKGDDRGDTTVATAIRVLKERKARIEELDSAGGVHQRLQELLDRLASGIKTVTVDAVREVLDPPRPQDLKELRESKGTDLDELVMAWKLSETLLEKYERGEGTPPYIAEAYAYRLGCFLAEVQTALAETAHRAAAGEYSKGGE